MLEGKLLQPELLKLLDTARVRQELICELCEEEQGEMVTCEAGCQASFHLSCLQLFKRPAGSFKCSACTTGTC